MDHSGRRSTFVVTHAADERSVVAYSVRLPGASLVVTRSVVDQPGGQTIRHHVKFRGPAGAVFALVLGRQFRQLVGPSLEALLAELEHPRGHEAI